MTEQTNALQRLLDAQEDLQVKAYSGSPVLLEGEDRVAFITWNVLAATDELHELLGEVGWKPWATSRHVNEEAAKGELVDALHFILNLALVLGMDGDEVTERYHRKHAKNAARQAEGYDGVTTKCAVCGRALDDAAVDCVRDEDGRLGDYVGPVHRCAKFGRVVRVPA